MYQTPRRTPTCVCPVVCSMSLRTNGTHRGGAFVLPMRANRMTSMSASPQAGMELNIQAATCPSEEDMRPPKLCRHHLVTAGYPWTWFGVTLQSNLKTLPMVWTSRVDACLRRGHPIRTTCILPRPTRHSLPCSRKTVHSSQASYGQVVTVFSSSWPSNIRWTFCSFECFSHRECFVL